MRAILMSLFALSASAHATVCVSIDARTDTFDKQQRMAARGLAESAFRSVGVNTMPAPCAKHYRISNVQLGRSVAVSIRGPRGVRKGKAGAIEELDSVYDQLVGSLVRGSAVRASRHNVTAAQADPLRVEADALWHFNIGTGLALGADPSEVPFGLGFGYRYELDQWAIDASARFVLAAGGDEASDSDNAFNGGIRLMGLYHFDPLASASAYLGGGLGWGGTVVDIDDALYSGGGLEGHLAAGYTFLRESTIRMYLQLDVTLPFYDLEHDVDGDTLALRQDDRYAPVVGLAFGLGWAR